MRLIWPKKVEHYKHKKLLSHVKMGKEILTFGDIEIDKNKIYGNKSPNFLKDVAIRKFIIN